MRGEAFKYGARQGLPGIDPGPRSEYVEPSGHEWIDQLTEASILDRNFSANYQQKLLKQLGETSWLEGHPTVGLSVLNRQGITESPILPNRVKHFFRGMSEHEFNQAKGRGYIQSDQRGTLMDWEGTNAGTRPATARNYLPSEGLGRIVKIAHHPDDQWFETNVDNYARTRQQIPWNRVVAHTDLTAPTYSENYPGTNYREQVRAEQKKNRTQ